MAEKKNILILKTGAAGDIVRTTSLLQYFQQESVTWITNGAYLPLFDTSRHNNLNVFPIDQIPDTVWSTNFQLILSLEEDEYCAKLAGNLVADKLTGVYWHNGIVYTKDAEGWFDMSLISIWGRARANEIKKTNVACYQDHLFAMVQEKFNGEPYSVYKPKSKRQTRLIGIEKTAGHRWPNKSWYGYDVLVELLHANGYETVIFGRYKYLQEYMQAVSDCQMIIAGDTLAMHLAMAYSIPVIGIFNCTSPAEIYDYGCLLKLISPRLGDYYYTTSFDPEAIAAIKIDSVIEAVELLWQRFYHAPNQIKVQGSF